MITNEALQMHNDILFKENAELKDKKADLEEQIEELKGEVKELKNEQSTADEEENIDIAILEEQVERYQEMFDKISDLAHLALKESDINEIRGCVDKILNITYQAKIN